MFLFAIAISLFNLFLTDGLSVQDPEGPDPPVTCLRGKITKIDAKIAGQVEIDIASDVGLKPGHVLEVYRLEPRPCYLGKVRILHVNASGSIGQMLPDDANPRDRVKINDSVISSSKR